MDNYWGLKSNRVYGANGALNIIRVVKLAGVNAKCLKESIICVLDGKKNMSLSRVSIPGSF